MKTKFKLSNRILSLVLALVMVVGIMPMSSMTAYAAPSEAATLPTSQSGQYDYSNNLTVYYKHNNYLYKAVFSNIKSLSKTGLYYLSNETILLAGERGLYLQTVANQPNGYDATTSDLPKNTGASISLYLRKHMTGYVNNISNAVVTITCMAVGEPDWIWNDTSSAKAVFTSTDNGATMTVDATITSSTQTAESCLEKGKIIYTATATANGTQYTDTKTVDGDAGPHSYTYSKTSDNTVTEKCSLCNDHTATATLTTSNQTYTGSPITTGADVSYSNGWAGSKEHGEITYSNNTDAGDATARVTVEGNELTTTFKINAADISGATVTLDPTSGEYTGNPYTPNITVTLDSFGTLVKGTHYTFSWDNDGFIAPDTYTVRVVGIDNFTGYVDKTFKINAADLKDVKVEQVGTLTYNGESQTPTVSTNAVAVNNQPVTFTYSTLEDGTYGTLPSFDKAGSYTVYYKATAPNHNEATGSFTVTVDKVTVTEPTIADKVYNGSVQTADVPASDLYTVVENNGGTGVKLNGYYDVVLELKDAANYKWSSTDNAQVTLQFAITRATNEWTATPSITGWTYGETAKTPVGSAKFGDVSIQYTGTANDGTQFSSMTAPTQAGSYTATFIVAETEDYSGLETSVDFTIAKATYDMTGAKWDYSEPFKYDGKLHTVWVDENSLPDGVSVSRYTGNNGSDVGKYTANVSLGYDIYNYNQLEFNYLLEWEIKNDWTPIEYNVSTLNSNGWINGDFVITAADGYKVSLTNTADGVWEDKLTYTAETDNGSVTFYLKNETDGTISLAKTENYKLDKNTETTGTTGKVEFVERKSWQEFVNTITFGLFFKDEVTVKAEATDALSEVASIEYAVSDKAMTLEEVKAITEWTAMPADGVAVTLEDAKLFVYFVRITDNADNVTYLSTDGAEYDTTLPAISGIENGETYYTTQVVTVEDKNLVSVELGGEIVTLDNGTLTLAGNVDATYTIKATDKAGNVTEYTVTMKNIAELTESIDDITVDDVTSDDKEIIEQVIEDIDEQLANDGLTEEEKAALEETKNKAQDLLDKINEAANADDTENTEKVKDITADNVTPEDKSNLEKAKEDLTKALDNYADNLTEDEKTAIEDEIDRIDNAIATLEKVEAVEDKIGSLPENITKNDEAAINAADDAYNALSDYEKSLVDKDAKKALDDAKAALAELNKPADTTSPNTGDNSNLWLWVALLFISGGAVITLTVVDRKRRTTAKR